MTDDLAEMADLSCQRSSSPVFPPTRHIPGAINPNDLGMPRRLALGARHSVLSLPAGPPRQAVGTSTILRSPRFSHLFIGQSSFKLN